MQTSSPKFIHQAISSLLFMIITSSLSFASDRGEQLYLQNCAACHGDKGTGGVGIPLTNPDFQYGASNDYLEKTIRFGRPGRVMPAFTELSKQDIKLIVKHIRKWAPGKPFAYPNKKIKGDVKKGKTTYTKYCASCHGANGEGGDGTGVTFSRPRGLPIIAPALNNSGFLKAAPDMMIKATLMNGREGTPMPSFLKLGLSESEIDNVVSYVRSFEKTPLKRSDYSKETAVISVESPLSFEETVTAIKRAILGKNFKLIRTQYMNHGLVKEGTENKKQVIIHFCNFKLLNEAMAVDPRVGMFLPCRITATEHKGKVMVSSINPLFMSQFFNNSKLDMMCKEMHSTYVEIIEESTF